jgi:hypothetical protein
MKITENSDVELAIGAKLEAGIVWKRSWNGRRRRAEDEK